MPLQFVGPALMGSKAITSLLAGAGTALTGYELAKMTGLLEPDTYRSSGFYGRGNKGRPGFSGPLGPMPRTQTSYGQLPADYKETELKEGAAAEAFRPGAGLPGQQFNPNQDLPASAEQSMDTTPMATANALYQQGREAARTQAERNQVRDLGLAIHKAHNPHLYSNFQTPMASDRTFNPLMARTFPETYAQTPEAFVASGGVQMPSSMSNADDRNAVIEGNRLEGEQRMMQEMAELKKQEFMREMLATQTGRK